MAGALSVHPSLTCLPVLLHLDTAGSGPAAISGDLPGAGSRAVLLLLSCGAGTVESPAHPPGEGGPSPSSQGTWEDVDACERRRAVGEGLGGRRASSCLPPATEGFPQGWVAGAQPAPVCIVLLAWPRCCLLGWLGQACPRWASTRLGHVPGSFSGTSLQPEEGCARRLPVWGEQEHRQAMEGMSLG